MYRLHNIVDSALLFMFQWQRKNSEISWGNVIKVIQKTKDRSGNEAHISESVSQHVIDQTCKFKW